MRVGNIHLDRSSITILNREVAGFIARPSTSIYYGKFPYRIVLDLYDSNDQENTHRQMHEFFRDSKFIGDIRFHKRFVYFADCNEFTDTIIVFSDIIEHVSGPLNNEHMELLYRKDISIEVRDKPYYNKFDSKAFVYFPFRLKGGPVANFAEKKQRFSEVAEFLSENVGKQNVRISNSEWCLDIYINHNTLEEVLPFMHLQQPGIVCRVTRCLVYDK